MRSRIIGFLLGLFFHTFASAVTPISDARLFAFAEANFPSIFTAPATAGQYLQYNYRHYPASGNLLAVDTSRVISIFGTATGNVLTPVGPVEFFRSYITDWEATQVATEDAGLTPANLLGGTIQKSTPLSLANVVSTFAGTNGQGNQLNGGFYEPQSITTDGTYLYVGDFSVIWKVSIATRAVTVLAGSAELGSAGMSDYADGTGTSARFRYPNGITTDGTYLYVTEFGDHTIRKVVIATGEVTTIAGGQGVGGSTDGTGTSARFEGPKGITTDGTNLYVAEDGGRTIRKITGVRGRDCTLTFTPVSVVTGNTTRWTLPAAGSITIAAAGYGYAVGDVLNVVTAQNGTGTVTVSDVDALGGVASLSAATAGTGYNNTLYTAQATTSKALALARTFRVTTLAGAKDVTTAWLDATGTAARFRNLHGITMDATNLYVTDTPLIRKVVIATGVVTTLAGDTSEHAGSYADGTGPGAGFPGLPGGIVSDGTNLYVSDNAAIRKVAIANGAITTIVGTVTDAGATDVGGYADGTGATAAFSPWVMGITSDGTSLYCVDSINNTIRKIQ